MASAKTTMAAWRNTQSTKGKIYRRLFSMMPKQAEWMVKVMDNQDAKHLCWWRPWTSDKSQIFGCTLNCNQIYLSAPRHPVISYGKWKKGWEDEAEKMSRSRWIGEALQETHHHLAHLQDSTELVVCENCMSALMNHPIHRLSITLMGLQI